MESMDVSVSADVANQSAFTEFENEENTVISDTAAGIITTRHIRELERLRWVKYEAERLADLAFECWSEYEKRRHEIFSARPIQKIHYIGTERILTLPSWTEMNRLRQLYEEDLLSKKGYVPTSEMRQEYKDKRDGENDQAAKIINELESLQRFVRRGGILWPLMLEAELVDDSPHQSLLLPEASTKPSSSSGAADHAHRLPTVKSEVANAYVVDSSENSDPLDSDVEVQLDDSPVTSSPRAPRTS